MMDSTVRGMYCLRCGNQEVARHRRCAYDI